MEAIAVPKIATSTAADAGLVLVETARSTAPPPPSPEESTPRGGRSRPPKPAAPAEPMVMVETRKDAPS